MGEVRCAKEPRGGTLFSLCLLGHSGYCHPHFFIYGVAIEGGKAVTEVQRITLDKGARGLVALTLNAETIVTTHLSLAR